MQTARVLHTSMGLACGTNTNYQMATSQSPLSATTSPQSNIISPPRNIGRRRSARNSMHNLLSSMIQYAAEITTDQSSNVQFEKRGVTRSSTTEHPQQSLLSEMLRRQMVGGGGNCAASNVTRTRGIRFDCGLTTTSKSNSLANTTIIRNVKPCLKFGQRPERQESKEENNTNVPSTALSIATLKKAEAVDPLKELQKDKNEQLPMISSMFNGAPATIKKIKNLSSPPVKSYLNRKCIQEEEEEDEEEDEENDDDEETGYMEDDEDDDEDQEEEDDSEAEEEEDNDETIIPLNKVCSAPRGTQATPIPIPTASCFLQEQITASPSSHYSTAVSLLTPPAHRGQLETSQNTKSSKSFPYSRHTSSDETATTSDLYPNKIPIRRRSRKVHTVKSIPIPKTYNSNHYHEPHHAHKRRHHKVIERGSEDALWIDIISARRMRMVVGGAGTSDIGVGEEDILWPLSI